MMCILMGVYIAINEREMSDAVLHSNAGLEAHRCGDFAALGEIVRCCGRSALKKLLYERIF